MEKRSNFFTIVTGSTLVSTTPLRRVVWAIPISLAATDGIEVSLSSSGYLDVSVPQVRFHTLCIQVWMTLRPGFPIRRSQDQTLVSSSLGLIAGIHVLHRLSTPRHPPHALVRLITPTSDRPSRPTFRLISGPRHGTFSVFDRNDLLQNDRLQQPEIVGLEENRRFEQAPQELHLSSTRSPGW